MDRLEMITELVQNEIDWVAGDPTYENIQSAVKFFALGGFSGCSDEKIERMYKNLTA